MIFCDQCEYVVSSGTLDKVKTCAYCMTLDYNAETCRKCIFEITRGKIEIIYECFACVYYSKYFVDR